MDESLFDPLTGLMTPYHFYESARRLRSWAERRGQELALIAIDLTGIDEEGMARAARALLQELRGGDLLARIGANNFALLLVGDTEAAGHLIFRLGHRVKPKLVYRATSVLKGEELTGPLARLGV